jgi:hypothetical protein
MRKSGVRRILRQICQNSSKSRFEQMPLRRRRHLENDEARRVQTWQGFPPGVGLQHIQRSRRLENKNVKLGFLTNSRGSIDIHFL